MKISLHLSLHYHELHVSEKLKKTMPKPLLEYYSDGGVLETVIFHAPDDVRTNKRPVSFDDYIPYSLANISPTDKDIEEIMRLADVAAEEPKANPDRKLWIPSPDEIIRVDGKWKVLWFAGKRLCPPKFDFREHFKGLCQKALQNNRIPCSPD